MSGYLVHILKRCCVAFVLLLLPAQGLFAQELFVTPIQFSTSGVGNGFDDGNAGGYNVVEVSEFDWQSSGNVVIVNRLPEPVIAGGELVDTYTDWLANSGVGDVVTFSFHFHARLNDMLQTSTGGGILPHDIATNGQLDGCANGLECKEITIVASGTQTAQVFQKTESSRLMLLTDISAHYRMIWDDTPDSTVDDTDSGGTVLPSNFLDGVAFMEGQATAITGVIDTSWGGDNQITLSIDAYDPAFIQTYPASAGSLIGSTLDILISLPGIRDTVVSVGKPIGQEPYLVQSADLRIKADANTEFRRSEPLNAHLGDRVWEDRNADGIQNCIDGGANNPDFPADGIIGNAGDAGPECDTGIPGVLVTLLDNPDGDASCDSGDEGEIASTYTDANGFYLFNELSPDVEYCVRFDPDSAKQQLQCDPIIEGEAAFSPANQGAVDAIDSDADTLTGQTGTIPLTAGQFDRSWDAGLYCPAKIGDQLTNDINRDGIQDADEPGVANQTVELLACVDGVPGVVIDSTTTGTNGMYMFNPLPPGEYAVRFTSPDGYVFSPKDQGGDDTIDCDADVNGVTDCVTLGSNEYNPTVDACVNLPPAGLGDFVWEDHNANGVQEGGEPGIEGVPVTLDAAGPDNICGTADDVLLANTVTDANGRYEFANLDAGDYCVTFDKSAVACEFGDASFSPANQGDDSRDSDADILTGQTGVISLQPNEFDPTNDAGIYCPAKLGDTVWEDSNADGIQDDVPTTEPGGSGVTVNLLDCSGDPVTDLDGVSSMFTDEAGIYMFRVLPGQYMVEFVSPADRVFTRQDQGGNDALDSDANTISGRTACITVPSNTYDDTWDAGLVTPPECGLAVDKSCEIVQLPPPSFTCDGKIDELVMALDPTYGDVVSVIAYAGDTSKPTLPVGLNGNEVTVSGYQAAGAPNDVIWEVVTTTGTYQSQFHLSCSDDEMDGETDLAAFPQDCGRPEGNGKNNDFGLNIWQLEGLTNETGGVLDCTPPAPVSASECVFQQQIASCASLPDKPSSLQLQYSGGGCSTESNSQDPSKTACSGSVDPTQPVLATFPGGSATVEPGATFTIPRDGSETTITLSNDGGTETITFHTSCSQPLETGDQYFSLTLVGLDGLGMGTEVEYGYAVQNLGTETISDISVVDDKLGVVASGLALSPGEMTTLSKTAFISQTTLNTVTVSGTSVPGAACEATDTANVTVLPPPPCDVAIVLDRLEDDKIKWKVTNTSARVATLDTFVLNFPAAYGEIKEVKLDGGIWKADESALVVSSGVTIGPDDWTNADQSKRELDPGETRTLEVVFTTKAQGADWSAIVNPGLASFEEGCSVALIKPTGCEIDKPTELVFAYTGQSCAATSNFQEDRFKCSETGTLGDLSAVSIDKDADKIFAEIEGSMIRIYRGDDPGHEFPADIKYTLTGTDGTQSHELHTSCSKALNLEDQFGGLILKEFVPKY